MFPSDSPSLTSWLAQKFAGQQAQGQSPFVDRAIESMNRLFPALAPPVPPKPQIPDPNWMPIQGQTEANRPFIGQGQTPKSQELPNRIARNIAESGLLGTPSNPMMMPAMVMSPENAQIIKQIMQYHLRQNPNLTQAQLAMKFMQAKNADLYGRIPIENRDRNWIETLRGVIGGHQTIPDEKITLLNMPNHRVEDYLETLAHEITHGIQNKNDPIGLNTAYQYSHIDFPKYKNQWFEVNARQGGATGRRAIENFKNIIGGAPNQLDLQTPITKNQVNELLMPGIAKRAAQTYTDPAHTEIVRESIRDALSRAGKTATGQLGQWERPYTVEDMIFDISGVGPERDDTYRKLAGNIYHGFTGDKFLSDPPRDMRSLKYILQMPHSGIPAPLIPKPPIAPYPPVQPPPVP